MSVDDTPSETKRKMPRRRFLKAAGASGVTVGLAGCIYGGDGGGGGGGDGGGTVQWAFDPTQAQNNSKKIKQLFHDNGLSDDITLKFITGGQQTGSRQTKYKQILKTGNKRPDMFMMDCGWTIPFIIRDQIANLTKELSEKQIKRVNNQYFNTSVNTAKNPKTGDLYGVPLFPDFPVMHYRKDLVKKAGYQPDKKGWATNPMTWKRFAKITKDVMKKTGTKYGYSFQFNNYAGLSCCDFNEFMTSWGGAYFGGRKNLFGPVGKRPVTVAKQPVQKSLRMIRTFIHGKDDPEALSGYTGSIAPTNVLSWIEEPSRKPFANGNVVMHRNWPYAIPLTLNSDKSGKWAKPENYGTMPIPYAVKESNALEPGTGGTTSALGGWNMTLNPNAANKDGALEVIKTAMKKEVQVGIFKITGWLPPDTSVFSSKEVKSVQPTGKYIDTLKMAGQNSMSRPVTIAWPQESTAIYQEVNAAAAQQQSTKKALNTLSKRIKDIEQSVAKN
jgi:ABC-type glycerol-3-phosphate transport system substrate-binding protein